MDILIPNIEVDLSKQDLTMRTFGCSYFHNICIKCKHKPQCYRKEPLIKGCNFYGEEKEI